MNFGLSLKFDIRYSKDLNLGLSFIIIRHLWYWIFYIQNLRSIGYSVSTVFFWKAIFVKSSNQDPHFVSHSNGPFSRHNTARRPQGRYLICSSCVGSSPASTVRPKNIRNFKHPKKYSSYPPKNIHFSENQRKILKSSKFWAQLNGPSLRMYENIRVSPSPLGRRRSLDEHSRVDNVWRIQRAFERKRKAHVLLNKGGPTARS